MAVKLKILPEYDLVVLAYGGSVTRAHIPDTLSEALQEPRYRFDFDNLVLLGPDADFSQLAFEDARQEAQGHVARHQGRLKRTAFVSEQPVQHAMARLFATYVETQRSPNVQVSTFSTLESALDWIEPSKGPDRKFDRPAIGRITEELGQDWCLPCAAMSPQILQR